MCEGQIHCWLVVSTPLKNITLQLLFFIGGPQGCRMTLRPILSKAQPVFAAQGPCHLVWFRRQIVRSGSKVPIQNCWCLELFSCTGWNQPIELLTACQGQRWQTSRSSLLPRVHQLLLQVPRCRVHWHAITAKHLRWLEHMVHNFGQHHRINALWVHQPHASCMKSRLRPGSWHLKNISLVGIILPNIWKNNIHVPNHQPDWLSLHF